MIFLLQGDLGDQVTMLPALVAHRREAIQNSIVLCDPRIKALIPFYPWLEDAKALPNFSHHEVVSLNVWDAVAKLGKGLHPTRMFFRYLGLDDPGEVVRPEIVVDESAPAYDYVIAPFANDVARSYPIGRLISLLSNLHEHDDGKEYGDDNILAIVGGQEDFSKLDLHAVNSSCADVFDNCTLSYVAGLMQNARKAVITVDSMANRLAHAAGVENHVLLCSDVVPEAWATHPGARVLYGPPSSWTVEKVLQLLPA